jgi:hypothetical protein
LTDRADSAGRASTERLDAGAEREGVERGLDLVSSGAADGSHLLARRTARDAVAVGIAAGDEG